MKKIKKLVTIAIMMVAIAGIFQSCKKSEGKVDYNSDKTKLSQQIDAANAIYNSAVEGKQAGDYTIGSKAKLKTAIDLAARVKTG